MNNFSKAIQQEAAISAINFYYANETKITIPFKWVKEFILEASDAVFQLLYYRGFKYIETIFGNIVELQNISNEIMGMITLGTEETTNKCKFFKSYMKNKDMQEDASAILGAILLGIIFFYNDTIETMKIIKDNDLLVKNG